MLNIALRNNQVTNRIFVSEFRYVKHLLLDRNQKSKKSEIQILEKSQIFDKFW